jgi:hypothetical protein
MTNKSPDFWSKVEKKSNAPCWRWTGTLRPDGYGTVGVNYRQWLAHRYAYTLCHGEIPTGAVVRHTCDHKWCCNPAHLVVGTQSDNMRDMVERRRSRRNEQHWNSKLSDEDVANIRRLYAAGQYSQYQLGRMYSIDHSYVGCIVRGEKRR